MASQPTARDRLLDAAEDLAATQGVNITSVDAILDRARVSPATLYAHFGNKEGLITEALRRRLARWDTTWQECIDDADSREEKLLAVFTALSRHRRALTPSRWCVFLGVAAETPHPGRDLQDTLAADTRLLLGRLEDLAGPVVGAEQAPLLARRIVLVYTGVLGMILRGADVDAATAEGRSIAALALHAVGAAAPAVRR
ncbi:TetR/AcrR family transcriptional regulator [Arthrobacter agilis]|jgi:AcrR family transcriptional regulator|uniref:TetR/AcrR family transcriptional regulator n=1 Tax=Arthrobacter agilis TaxID=37921 RepID=UPI002785B62D|nr:TetR/AcrR family transcriptional regulator [Arthrobacter agilis]MDQ0736104.1 AcrR family transcriptional regulator [Arthrobacter agilis]